MINRRDFIKGSAAGAATLAAAADLTRSVFANPYGKPIGLQLYTVREQLEKDVPETLKKVAAIGYKEVEIYDLYGMSPAVFSKLVKDNGLTAISGHYLLNVEETQWEKKVAEAKELGLKYMVHAILDPPDRKSIDDYKRHVDLFNKNAELSHKAGIQFCYHNHDFEFQKFDGVSAFDYLLKHLDLHLVQFEMDCFWVTHAGQDPVALMKQHPGRFPLLHIKDLKAGIATSTEFDARMGLFAEVGKGVIDWKRIFVAAKEGGLERYFVEQDESDIPAFEAMKISYDYLHNLTV